VRIATKKRPLERAARHPTKWYWYYQGFLRGRSQPAEQFVPEEFAAEGFLALRAQRKKDKCAG
jgi:hypothetical protein